MTHEHETGAYKAPVPEHERERLARVLEHRERDARLARADRQHAMAVGIGSHSNRDLVRAAIRRAETDELAPDLAGIISELGARLDPDAWFEGMRETFGSVSG